MSIKAVGMKTKIKVNKVQSWHVALPATDLEGTRTK